MTSEPAGGGRASLAPRQIVLAVLWLAATVTYVALLASGMRRGQDFAALRDALHAAYSAALLWYLASGEPSIGRLPEFTPVFLARWRFGRVAAVAVVALVFCLTVLSGDGTALLLLALLVAAVAALVAWRRQVTARSVVLGLALSLVAFVTGGIAFWRHGFVGRSALILFLVLVPPMFVAGGLLVSRTGLGASRLLEGRYAQALRSFLWGCVLFVPLGLANAAGTAPSDLAWVERWWQPIALPLWSGIDEEVVFRLMLVTLCFALLRPAWKGRPAVAFWAAALFSAVTFGLGHGRTVGNLVFAGLLYGLPFSVVFARRDLEHAVGAHYMVNFVNWVLAFLGG